MSRVAGRLHRWTETTPTGERSAHHGERGRNGLVDESKCICIYIYIYIFIVYIYTCIYYIYMHLYHSLSCVYIHRCQRTWFCGWPRIAPMKRTESGSSAPNKFTCVGADWCCVIALAPLNRPDRVGNSSLSICRTQDHLSTTRCEWVSGHPQSD